jgi:hypothetical protein
MNRDDTVTITKIILPMLQAADKNKDSKNLKNLEELASALAGVSGNETFIYLLEYAIECNLEATGKKDGVESHKKYYLTSLEEDLAR